MERPIVFLSHSSTDGAQLAALKALLDKRAAGCLDFFLSSDGQSIRFGRNWVTRISDALSEAQLMFVFISPRSMDSKWIHFEAGCAYAKDIQVVPVCLPGMDLNRVTPPLSLLQGFNLHGFDSLSNLARVCNETFELKIAEGFSAQDFNSVFSESATLNQGFFGNTAWAIDHVGFSLDMVTPEPETFDPVPQLKSICEEEKKEFLLEETTQNPAQPSQRFELPGVVLSISKSLVGNAGTGQRSKRIVVGCTLSPELFHLNAPLLDRWYAQAAFQRPWSVDVHFKDRVIVEAARHQLTTKLYNSGIRVSSLYKFDFEGLVFSLVGHTRWRLCFECRGNLQDPRLPTLINKLVELQVVFENPADLGALDLGQFS